jgi:threonine/homoserine/homoserine lactone efflux protein
MSKGQICGIAVTLMLVAGVLSWIFTAPYMSSQGRAGRSIKHSTRAASCSRIGKFSSGRHDPRDREKL